MLSEESGETGVRVYQEDVLQGDMKHFNTFAASYLNTQGHEPLEYKC